MKIPGGQLKNEMEFPVVMKKKSCEISMGLAFGFQSWNFQEVSYKLAEKYILTPCSLDFFLNNLTFLRNLL